MGSRVAMKRDEKMALNRNLLVWGLIPSQSPNSQTNTISSRGFSREVHQQKYGRSPEVFSVTLSSKVAFRSRAELVITKRKQHVVAIQSLVLVAKNPKKKYSAISKTGPSPGGGKYHVILLSPCSVYFGFKIIYHYLLKKYKQWQSPELEARDIAGSGGSDFCKKNVILLALQQNF